MENQDTILNIASNSLDPDARILSNLAPTPFILDGIHYWSVEAFWKSLYLPEEERSAHIHKHGLKSRDIYYKDSDWKKREHPKEFIYQWTEYSVWSTEHHWLMRRAIEAKIEQNQDVRGALMNTKWRVLQHIPINNKTGKTYPDSPVIPGEVFSGMLTEFREKLLKTIVS